MIIQLCKMFDMINIAFDVAYDRDLDKSNTEKTNINTQKNKTKY